MPQDLQCIEVLFLWLPMDGTTSGYYIFSVPFHMDCPACLARLVTMYYIHVLNPLSKQLKWKQEDNLWIFLIKKVLENNCQSWTKIKIKIVGRHQCLCIAVVKSGDNRDWNLDCTSNNTVYYCIHIAKTIDFWDLLEEKNAVRLNLCQSPYFIVKPWN